MPFGTLTAADITGDLTLADATETVTVLQVNAQTGATTATIPGVTAFRRVRNDAMAEVGDGQVPVSNVRFHLLASALGVMLKKRDRVEDAAGTLWDIDTVATAALGTRIVCDCTKVQ